MSADTSTMTVFERHHGSVKVTVPADGCADCMTFGEPHPATVGGALLFTQCPAHPTSVLAITPSGAEFTVHVGHRPALLDAWEEARLLNADTVLLALDSMTKDPSAWLVDLTGDVGAQHEQVERAIQWAVFGHHSREMSEWVSAGIEGPWAVKPWRDATFRSAQEVAAWIEAGVRDPAVASSWRAGFATAQDAALFGDVRAWAFCQQDGLPVDPAWGALFEDVNPPFARAGLDMGQGPAAVARLGRALRAPLRAEAPFERARYVVGVMLSCPWSMERTQRLVDLVSTLDGLDWADVAACMETGMTFEQAREHVTTGKDMDAVHLVAGLL